MHTHGPFRHIALGGACLLLAAACSTSSHTKAGAGTTTTRSPATTTRTPATTTTTGGSTATSFHMSHLADHETPGIASQLTAVVGYEYRDALPGEVSRTLDFLHTVEKEAGVDSFFRSLSLHTVVADDATHNTAHDLAGDPTTGVLSLMEFPKGVSPGQQRDFATGLLGDEPPTEERIANGTTYYVFRDDQSVDQRWTLTWVRHGVVGTFAAATLPEADQWVRRYLLTPERQPRESDALGRQLVAVPGWTYANWWELVEAALIPSVFGETQAASVHSVNGAETYCCDLALAVVTPGTTIDDLHPPFAPTAGSRRTETIAGTPTRRDTDGQTVAVFWMDGNVAAMCIGNDALEVDKFVRAYLTAKRSPHTADT